MVWVRERTIPTELPPYIYILEDAIKTDLREIGWNGMGLIEPAQDRNRQGDLVLLTK
jgi:hypothetical protein